MQFEFDVTIVGNGAISSALALRLSEDHKDLRIAIVGPAPRPGCASLAAGAMLNVFAELEAGALDHPIARAKFEAAVAASTMWEGHLALLNARLQDTAPLSITQGTYVVANTVTDGLDDANFDAIIAYLTEYKQRFREVDPRSIKGIKPSPQARPLRAIYLEDEGAISSKHLHRAYDEAFSRSESVTMIDSEVTGVSPSGDASRATTVVTTKSGAILKTRHVVIAAGTRTQDLVNQLGLQAKIPRLVHGVGVSLILKSQTEVPEKVFRTPNRGLACGLYVVPYADNYCYVGATNYICPWEVPLPRVQAVHYLLQCAMEQVNTDFYKGEIHKTIVGYRPTTLDSYPLLGRTSIEGLWIASGTKRDGFHLSPNIAAQFTAAITAQDSGKSDAQPFGGAFIPERALLLPAGKQASMDRSVAHIISTGYQHGFRLPHSNWQPLIADAVRAKVEDAYTRSGLGDHDFGIPAELLDMYRYGHAKENLEHFLAQREAGSGH
jgi:glycine oxidase